MKNEKTKGMTEEEKAAARSAAAKKAAATRKAKAEAAKAAEVEAARKAAEEEKSSSTAAVIDGTETKAEATSTNGDGTSSSSSAIIVLPAGDTGKDDANTQSATFIAPATNSDNHVTSEKEEKGEGPMSKVLKFLGWALALVMLAALIVVLLTMKGCTGAQSTITPSAPSATTASADAEAKVSALSAALAAKDAENEALRAQLSAASQQAPVNVNVDNSNTVVVDNTAVAEAQAEARAWQDKYYQVFEECSNLQVINGDLEARCTALEDECACLRAREPGTSVVYVDRDVIKTVTIRDTEEEDRLNGLLASAMEEISNLKEQIRNHVCPSCDGSCSFCKNLEKALEQKDRKIQELEAELEGWSHHVCTGGCDGNCWYAQMWNNHTCSGCDGSCECGGGGSTTGATGAHNPGPRADQERPKVEAEGPDEDATTGAAHNPPQRP